MRTLKRSLLALLAALVAASSQALVAAPATAKSAEIKPDKPVAVPRSADAPETTPVVPEGDFRGPPGADGTSSPLPAISASFDPTTATVIEAETTPTQRCT